MNALAIKRFDGEILTASATVRVIGKTHPLRGGRIECQVCAGLSIDEILDLALSDFPNLRARRDFAVHIDGHVIAEQNWHRVRVKPGRTVTFWPRLQNGSTLRTVLGVVIAVSALIVAPQLAPGLVTALAAVGITATAATATALITGGIILAGTMALNALFPVAAPAAAAAATPLNSIQGAQNQANPFGPIPVVLGTMLQSPYYAAKPYTEIIGDDQYLRLLFCLGYGPLNVSAIQIGATPLSAFTSYDIELRQGFVGDPAITLYPGEVDEVEMSITLDDTVDGAGVQGGNGAWTSQFSAVGAQAISLDFTATGGINAVDGQGNPYPWEVQIGTRYRLVGAGSWTTGPIVSFFRSYSPTRQGVYIPVAPGQYEVAAHKMTGNGDPQFVQDVVVWTALRSFKAMPPITFPKPLALLALRIKATDQLSGLIANLNCICTSLVLSYSGSGSTWTANTATQNPADLFRYVLQSPANARPVADALINLTNLQDWWIYCTAQGFKFNQVVNSTGSVYDKLCDIAAAGRAVPTFIDGQWGVIWDRPADSIVQHFTPRNSWGFQGVKPYAQQPHGWRVKFINELNGYTEDEQIVYDDGYSALNATLFEGIQFPGVTDPSLIWKHGRFQIAQARLRPEKITLNVGWENLICTRGDRVAVTHDVLLIGLASGRVKSVAGQVVTFDETVTVDGVTSYGMSFRLAGATSPILRALDATAAGDYNSLTLVGDLTGIEVGALFAFGPTSQEYAVYRVQAIAHQKDLVAALTLVDDAQAISTADRGPIPPYNPNITIPPDPFTLPPRGLRYQEAIDGQGASVRAMVVLTWQVPRFGKITSFEVQSRDDDVNGSFVTVDSVLPPSTTSRVPLTSAGIWSFRVRCIFDDGTVSSWVLLDHLTLQGLSVPPAPVANLRDTYITGRNYLSWDSPVDPRIVPVEIRKGATFGSAQIIADAAVSPWQTVGDDLYWVTTYVVSPFGVRIYSSPTQSITIENSVAIQNVVVSHDERADGWKGTFSGSVGIDQGSNFLRTAGVDNFLGRPDMLGTGNFLDGDGTLQGGGYYWSPTIVNTGGVTFCRVSNDWTATGVSAKDDFLGNPDFLGQPDFLKASLSQFVRVRPVIRISQVGPAPVWGAVQVWSPDVYQGWMFQLGMQFEILPTTAVPDPGAIAYLLSWAWTVDVPDRLDSYQNLTVPIGGKVITFQPSGSATPLPFNGGLNGEALPHLTPSIANPAPGTQVVWSALTTAGVTLQVLDSSGTDVGGSAVNLLAYGY